VFGQSCEFAAAYGTPSGIDPFSTIERPSAASQRLSAPSDPARAAVAVAIPTEISVSGDERRLIVVEERAID
jgi:hypothetical protein